MHLMPVEETLRMARAGEITDVPSAPAPLWCESLLCLAPHASAVLLLCVTCSPPSFRVESRPARFGHLQICQAQPIRSSLRLRRDGEECSVEDEDGTQ